MKYALSFLLFFATFNYAYSDDINTNNSSLSLFKTQILDVIENGSNRLGYPMGMMPPGMAQGAEAEEIATYVAGGMKGEQPASFAICGSCHGADGKGNNGMSPNLAEYASKKYAQNIVEENKEVMTEEKPTGTDFRAGEVRDIEKACNDGDGEKCAALGLMYKAGIVVEKSELKSMEYYFKSVDLLHKSCVGGNPAGCYSLGTMYYYGQGVKENHTKSNEFFIKACNMGFTESCKAIESLKVQ